MSSQVEYTTSEHGETVWKGTAGWGDRIRVFFDDGSVYVDVARDGGEFSPSVTLPPSLLMKLAIEVIKRYG